MWLIAPKTYAYRGQQKTAAELAAIAGISRQAMHGRLNKSRMSPEEAVTHPFNVHRRDGRFPNNMRRPA